MSHVLRPARADDAAALYRMAKGAGDGFTNLPADRDLIEARLARAAAALARDDDTPADDLFFFVLEDRAAGEAIGTCQIFAHIGATWPFYSYRIDALTQYSRELGRALRSETLSLSTDLDGCSEVGGLFLQAGERSAGVGALLARSRYLFIAGHRARFGDRTVAELRGVHDEAGSSPFWDGIGSRFFGMSFQEADRFNSRHGNQFIADLMPRHPIYLAMLPAAALAAIGVPHQSGRAAMRMLEAEGFAYRNYVDIFDGGPTMTAPTDQIATIRHARRVPVAAIRAVVDGRPSLVAHGRLAGFRASVGSVSEDGDGVVLDAACAARVGAGVGDLVTHVPR